MEPKPDGLGDHDGSQLRERGSSPAARPAGRRLTRSRARELGLEVQAVSLEQIGGRKGKKRRLAAEEGSKELESLSKKKDLEEQQQEGTQMSVPAGEGPKDLESLSKKEGLEELQQERTQMSIPAGGVDRRRCYPSMFGKRDGMPSPRDAQLLDGAPWLVHVSSTALDGKEIFRCSGTIIHRDKEEAWILTSYRVVFCTREGGLYNPMPKLAIHVEKAVHLPNKGKYEGKMLFFSECYEFALLKIDVESTIKVEPPCDGPRPWYNGKVLTLARDKEMSLKLRHGTIMWRENEFFLFVNCRSLPCGIGGPVINHAGQMVGIACYYNEGLAIISITTIRTCIQMWTKFGCIARPMFGMAFRTVIFLDIVSKDRLSYKYKINSGFIVDEVADQCEAEKLGIRRGNVINLSNLEPCYLPEFEDYLLNIGLQSLGGMSPVNDFKFEVYDLLGKAKRTITLPLQLTQGSEC